MSKLRTEIGAQLVRAQSRHQRAVTSLNGTAEKRADYLEAKAELEAAEETARAVLARPEAWSAEREHPFS